MFYKNTIPKYLTLIHKRYHNFTFRAVPLNRTHVVELSAQLKADKESKGILTPEFYQACTLYKESIDFISDLNKNTEFEDRSIFEAVEINNIIGILPTENMLKFSKASVNFDAEIKFYIEFYRNQKIEIDAINRNLFIEVNKAIDKIESSENIFSYEKYTRYFFYSSLVVASSILLYSKFYKAGNLSTNSFSSIIANNTTDTQIPAAEPSSTSAIDTLLGSEVKSNLMFSGKIFSQEIAINYSKESTIIKLANMAIKIVTNLFS